MAEKISPQRLNEILAGIRAGRRPIGLGGMGIYDGDVIVLDGSFWEFDSGASIQMDNYGGLLLESAEV